MSRVGSGWGVNLGGVSLEALALPPLYLAARPRISRVLKQKSLRLPSVLGRMPLLWASPCVASALEAAEHVSVWWAVPMPANSKATTRPQTHLKARPGRSPPGCRDELLVWCAVGSPGLGELRGEGGRGGNGGRRDPARERVVSNSSAAKRLRLSTTRMASATNPRRLTRMLHS